MTFSAWRITKEVHSRSAFSGEGARLYGGRWNSRGSAVIYTSQSQSLAVLEMLVQLDSPELLKHFVLVEVTIPSALVEDLDVTKLHRNWKENPISVEAQEVGDSWLRRLHAAVLRVPSTLVPSESNFLLNPAHPEFRKFHLGKAVPFAFDSRLHRRG